MGWSVSNLPVPFWRGNDHGFQLCAPDRGSSLAHSGTTAIHLTMCVGVSSACTSEVAIVVRVKEFDTLWAPTLIA